jgi:hypothetical protein
VHSSQTGLKSKTEGGYAVQPYSRQSPRVVAVYPGSSSAAAARTRMQNLCWTASGGWAELLDLRLTVSELQAPVD